MNELKYLSLQRLYEIRERGYERLDRPYGYFDEDVVEVIISKKERLNQSRSIF